VTRSQQARKLHAQHIAWQWSRLRSSVTVSYETYQS